MFCNVVWRISIAIRSIFAIVPSSGDCHSSMNVFGRMATSCLENCELHTPENLIERVQCFMKEVIPERYANTVGPPCFDG